MFEDGFYNGKKVLITGHTGFKGTWMCHMLHLLGADVAGYALQPPTMPNLYDISNTDKIVKSIEGDIRDLPHLKQVFDEECPEIVIHMAAQPIVRESYNNPVYTYEVNVMGTVNVMECIRLTDSVRSFVNVTTDKVYKNKEWCWGYREDEELNGYDPYSNSKSCSELVTDSYKKSFFADNRVAISTARAGNVIGGGDFAKDRIIPDCMRAVINDTEMVIRNPYSTRPYQHVLEPLSAYLLIAQRQYEDISYEDNYNVGPNEDSCLTTGRLVEEFFDSWNLLGIKQAKWKIEEQEGPHEANFLKLDNSKIKNRLGWAPVWDYETTLQKTVEWLKAYINGENISIILKSQIEEYLK